MKMVTLTKLFLALIAVALVPTANAQQAPTPANRPVVKAKPVAKAVAKAKPTAGESSALRTLSATVFLNSGTKLLGTLLDTTELPMRTSFGQANIPLSEVAGIKFAQEGNATTTVILHNGDTLTGATDLSRVNVETEWGKAEVNGPSITSIMFAQGLKWVAEDGLNGQRWKLAEAKQAQPQRQSSGTAQTQRVVLSDGSTVVRRISQ